MNSVFQALSDPTRREILRVLRERDFTAGELAERFPLAKSTLSGHFAVLKNAGLILSERNRTSIVYSLNVSVFEQTMAAILEIFSLRALPVEIASTGDEAPGSTRTAGGSPADPALEDSSFHRRPS